MVFFCTPFKANQLGYALKCWKMVGVLREPFSSWLEETQKGSSMVKVSMHFSRIDLTAEGEREGKGREGKEKERKERKGREGKEGKEDSGLVLNPAKQSGCLCCPCRQPSEYHTQRAESTERRTRCQPVWPFHAPEAACLMHFLNLVCNLASFALFLSKIKTSRRAKTCPGVSTSFGHV